MTQLFELSWCHILQAAIWTIQIIIHSPMIHNISHLIDVQEYLIVKQLISHTGIKRLNISILPRTTRLNKFCSLSE